MLTKDEKKLVNMARAGSDAHPGFAHSIVISHLCDAIERLQTPRAVLDEAERLLRSVPVNVIDLCPDHVEFHLWGEDTYSPEDADSLADVYVKGKASK